MPISIVCPGCGKRLKAADRLAGRAVPCPGCRHTVQLPPPDADPETLAYDLLATAPEPPPPVPVYRPTPIEEPGGFGPRPPRPRRAQPKPSEIPVSELPPLSADETPLWLRHLHWLLALALIPLVYSLVHKDANRDDILDRLQKTIEQAPPESRARIAQKLADVEDDRADLDDLFRELPRGRLIGAFLPRHTWAHWGFAGLAVVLFMSFCMLLAADHSAEPLHLLLVGLFTATVGIFMLLALQVIAAIGQGVWVRGGGIMTLILIVLKIIGYSYRAALDPDNGFILSLLGFTVGVGLCEETCKLLPVLVRFWQPNHLTWRSAFLWGLVSGAGFGISEGITYAGDFYNGISGPGVYLVRFVSCVALHAVWTGSAAVMLHQHQNLLHRGQPWYERLVPIFVFIGIPMLLHGLYDTFLKKEINAGALAVAVLSFGFLAVLIYRLRGADDAAAHKEMMREYRRRRKAMQQ